MLLDSISGTKGILSRNLFLVLISIKWVKQNFNTFVIALFRFLVNMRYTRGFEFCILSDALGFIFRSIRGLNAYALSGFDVKHYFKTFENALPIYCKYDAHADSRFAYLSVLLDSFSGP